jgi:hypothetical protein
MKVERLNPLNDYLFLKYMGEKGDEEQQGRIMRNYRAL